MRISEFGEEEIFRGWGELEIVEGQSNLSQILPDITVEQVKAMSLWEICFHSGYGLVSFHFEDLKKNVHDPIVSYRQMRLIRLNLPSYIEDCISGFSSTALSTWTEARDTDPVVLYQYVKILSEYKHYKELILGKEIPKTWEEHELLAVRLSLKEFFRTFSSLDTKQHPVSSNRINVLIDMFLDMIDFERHKENNRLLV